MLWLSHLLWGLVAYVSYVAHSCSTVLSRDEAENIMHVQIWFSCFIGYLSEAPFHSWPLARVQRAAHIGLLPCVFYVLRLMSHSVPMPAADERPLVISPLFYCNFNNSAHAGKGKAHCNKLDCILPWDRKAETQTSLDTCARFLNKYSPRNYAASAQGPGPTGVHIDS